MGLLEEISENLQVGRAKTVRELVRKAIDEGINHESILKDGLLAGMSIISEKFKGEDVYVPEVLIASRAMNAGTEIAESAQIIACSSLLTTTMGEIRRVVETAVEAGVREKLIIMIGGAPVIDNFCKKVGADIYTHDAVSAADAALKVCTG